MFFNTIPNINRRIIRIVEPSCQYAYENVPKVTLAINIIILALKHFQEKETSTLTASDALSISLVPFVAIIHLYHLHSKVLSQIPLGIGNGNYRAQLGVLSAEARQALALKEHESMRILFLITFAEIALTAFLIFLTWISKNNFKRTLTIEIIQFLVEISFVLAETKVYDYGVNTLRRLKDESRTLRGRTPNLPQRDHDLNSDDDSSNSTHRDDEAHEENASNHSGGENVSNNAGIGHLSNAVRSFSYSESRSDNSQNNRNSPDSQSVPNDEVLSTLNHVTLWTNEKNTEKAPGSPQQITNLFHGLSPAKIG